MTAEAKYDVLGNITDKSGQGAYQYDSATDRLSTVGAHAYSYDDNGNVLSDGERTLTWTAQNMVRSLQRGGQAWSLLYDADGTRVVREEAAANTATYTVAPTYELRFEGSEVSEARISVLGGTGRVVAEVFAEHSALEENGLWEHTKKYVHDDHLGSAHLVTDREGAVESRVMYGPWGTARDGNNWSSALSESALDELPVGFTGHQPELDAGIINMRGRMYDPAVGRFMSGDPVIENPLEVGTWNAYSYVQNRPLSLVDPTGLAAGTNADIERHEGTLAGDGFVGADYQDVDAYNQQHDFWTPYKAQTHGPRVEEEVAKNAAAKAVELRSRGVFDHGGQFDSEIEEAESELCRALGGCESLKFRTRRQRRRRRRRRRRPLTEAEREFLRAEFGDSINYDRVRVAVARSNHIGWFRNVIYLEKMHFRSGDGDARVPEVNLASARAASVFAHEGVHLWQRSQLVAVWPRSLAARDWAALTGGNAYAYNDPAGYATGIDGTSQMLRDFRQLGVEGQAAQYKDYIYRRKSGDDVGVYAGKAVYVGN